MGKGRLKSDEKKKKVRKIAEKEAKSKREEIPEDPFDFGGLPNRDLKKNLGCG